MIDAEDQRLETLTKGRTVAMAMWTNSAKPEVACICGGIRILPVDACGDPPVGMESLCVDCGRTLVLTSYSADRSRWSWTAEDPPKTDIKALNLLARRALGIEAALAGLGLTWQARGTA